MYMKWKNLTFDDICYVSYKTFVDGLTSVEGAIGAVCEKVGQVHRQLAGQIDEVDCKVDQSLRIVEDTQSQLGIVRGGVEELNTSLDSVRAGVERCEARLMEADDRHGYVHRGMHLLCRVVSEVLLPTSGNAADHSAISSLQDFVQQNGDYDAPIGAIGSNTTTYMMPLLPVDDSKVVTTPSKAIDTP